jgi:tetratricopeptide (TPR) repeat protein
MLPIDVLHTLIQSLTKSEKRYFRLTVSRQEKGSENAYLKLFNCLEANELFADPLKEQLRSDFPGVTLEPARKHLYNVLMRSLRQYEAQKSVDEKLMNLIQDSRILFNRGLINASFDQLEKAKELALQNEKFMFYILAARQELQFIIPQQFVGWDESRLVEKQEKIRELLEHELTVQQHSALYELLLLRYWKTGVVRNLQEIVRLNDLLLEEHQVLTSQRLESFESQQLHLHFQSTYLLMTENPEGSLQVLHELDDLFRRNKDLWADRPIYYIQLLNGILQTLRATEQYHKMTYFLERLEDIITPSESLVITVTFQVLEHRLHIALNSGMAQQALEMIHQQSEIISRDAPKLTLQMQVQLWLTTSRIYYSLGNFSKALFYINHILNQPTRSLSRILYISCRLMNLMIHVSLNDRDYIHYEIRSIERKLKHEKNWYRVEQFVLKLMKAWLKNKSCKSFAQPSIQLMQDPFERQLILELGLKDWFEFMTRK